MAIAKRTTHMVTYTMTAPRPPPKLIYEEGKCSFLGI